MAFNDGACLCVRGIPTSCREADLDALFRSYGRVDNVRVPIEPVSKGHRGYAFVTMNNPVEAEACISALNGMEFSGCRISVEVSKRSAPHVKTPGVYLGLPHLRGALDTSRGLHEPGRGRLRRRRGGASAVAAAAPGPRQGRSEPLVEPMTEPGGEPPMIKEDPLCCAEKGPQASKQLPESPRSRIRRLEEANVRVVAKQTVDGLLLQFQQQGFADPRAAAHESLQMSLNVLGMPAASIPIASAEASLPLPGPQVILSPDEFKNPSSFLRCYGDPLAATAPRHGGCIPESNQDGNWRCERCGNVNFPRRQRCHKCQETRGPNGDAIVLRYCLRVYEQLLKGKACD